MWQYTSIQEATQNRLLFCLQWCVATNIRGWIEQNTVPNPNYLYACMCVHNLTRYQTSWPYMQDFTPTIIKWECFPLKTTAITPIHEISLPMVWLYKDHKIQTKVIPRQSQTYVQPTPTDNLKSHFLYPSKLVSK
jgi:hypothetical protein